MTKIVGIIKDDPITGVEYGEVTLFDTDTQTHDSAHRTDAAYKKAKQLQHARMQKARINKTNKK